MFRVGKFRIFSKLLEEPSRCSLLAVLEKEERLSKSDIVHLKKCRANTKQQKEKTSPSLPSDSDSILQALK